MVETIKGLCQLHELTVQKLEKALGFGNGTIRRWDESTPSSAKVSAVAQFFGVPDDYIIYGPEEYLKRVKSSRAIAQELSEDEATILDLFRSLPEDERQSVLLLLRRAAKRK